MRSFSLSVLLLVFGLPAAAQTVPDFADRVGEVYQASTCAKKTSELSGEDKAKVTESLKGIIRTSHRGSNEGSIYALIDTVRGGNGSFVLKMHCLPPLREIAPYKSWVELLKENGLKNLGKGDSPEDQIVGALAREIGSDPGPEAAAARLELLELLKPVYSKFELGVTVAKAFNILDDSEKKYRALQLAASMGDERAFAIAEKAVKTFLEGRSTDDKDGIHSAVMALSAYPAKGDRAVLTSRDGLLKKVGQSEHISKDTKRLLPGFTSAR